jgi:glycosyltransferase involved in cell wall biosynthesis
MLKIGLLSPFLPEKDGLAIYADNLLRNLGKRKKQVTTIGRKGSKADYIVNFRSLTLKKDLERIIKKEKLDLIHVQYVAAFFSKWLLNYNLISALELPVPTIVTLHEVQYSANGLRNSLLARIERGIIKHADRIIVHTPRQKRFLENKYGTRKVTLIYHGVRLNSVPKKNNAKNLLCFGMISEGKGVKYLIKAMEYLPKFKLTIAGRFVNKKIKNEILQELKKPSSGINRDFGWISEKKKAEYFRNAGIVILPHTWAPYQSGILHNAVAWGLPVVATRTGALYEIVEMFKLGAIVPPRNPKSLAEGIRKISKNYKTYGKGIKRYRDAASWPEIAKQHWDLYEKISK